MSQTWTTNVYESTHSADTDLSNMEANFASLKSSFSGASQPSDAVAGMLWFDTTKLLLKHRNNANSAWRGVMAGSASFKIWAYLAAAEDGWAIDSSIADRVLAVKSASGTYVTAASTAGSWTISGIGITHSHTAADTATALTISSPQYNVTEGSPVCVTSPSGRLAAYNNEAGQTTVYLITSYSCGNHTHTIGNNSAGASHDGAWRPAAAVGVIMYPDV